VTDQETIAVLGAGGTMGRAMAANLARAGYPVRAWNRSPEKAAPLAGDGARVCATPSEAADGATILLTMLSDADPVLEAVGGPDGAAPGLGPRAVWLQMSTIGLDGTRRAAELARDHGLVFVDAPVLGTKAPAEKGELVVLASGPDDVHPRVDPVFEVVGRRTLWVGEAGAGTRLKLATNSWVLTIVEGAAETLALAEGLGLDPRLVLEAVAGGPLDLPYLQTKGKAMIERDFEPSFRLALAAKDARLAAEAAGQAGLDLPLLITIRDRLERGADSHGDEDLAATFLTSAPA
jgi:3-hydroxyisobutyrate dehydrogenase